MNQSGASAALAAALLTAERADLEDLGEVTDALFGLMDAARAVLNAAGS